MEELNLKPDPRLFRKQIYIILTVSFVLLFIGLLLQILVPLDPRTSADQVAAIVWPIILGLIFLLWIISIPIMNLWVKNLDYFIENDRIRIHKGILSKIQQNIPYRAITDFVLQRSLYDRFLGIASIRIQTAGQSATPTGYEGNLAGLTDWDNRINDLRSKVKAFHVQSHEKTVNAPGDLDSSADLLKAMLYELKKIRESLENK